jgi:proteasome assembly chaperone (PAC2) family protein
MDNEQQLNDPWLIAAWPGMGAVAISAGYYLMAKLGMHLLAEFPAREFFDLERVEVKGGLILTGTLPRSRLFLWQDPARKHDLIVFIGEAQPPAKGAAFCAKLIGFALKLRVRRVFTFAAMATQMRPEHASRVFGAAIDPGTLEEFKRLDVQALQEAQISGLNGVLLAVAADSGLKGGCLLGEMPQMFSQFPFPKASLTVLKAFSALAAICVDLTELEVQSRQVGKGLEEFLHHVEHAVASPEGPPVEVDESESRQTAKRLSSRDKQLLEELFASARLDRSRAYELKRALDRLHVFQEYEDRFLDLFHKPG